MPYTIDVQAASETCEPCSETYAVSRGSVYDDGTPFALYLAGMHHCHESFPLVVMAIALADPGGSIPASMTVRVWPTDTEYQMSIVEPDISPWATHSYLGRMLTRQEALDHPSIQTFWRVAGTIISANPEVNHYLES